jgi:hypothetical protein
MPAMAPQCHIKLLILRRKAYLYDMERTLSYRHEHGAAHRDGPGDASPGPARYGNNAKPRARGP